MSNIVSDTSKFEKLGSCDQCDGTAKIERSLQNLLRNRNKADQIPDGVYKEIYPTGTTRLRIYGIPKIHKDGTPLRPILSMAGSPQHAIARWLADLLKPVVDKYSGATVKDSFEFCESIRSLHCPSSTHMCSFDIKSLFTNVPIHETIRICATELYHSDLEVPTLKEDSFVKLMKKVTTGVEFSYREVMYRQIGGVAMGLPLGPVLANIVVGYQEQRLLASNPNADALLLYKRYVDDTFSLSLNTQESSQFLEQLNSLHPALQFTCENEDQGSLPFLDARVIKKYSTEEDRVSFDTTVYRKPTFSGQYTRWDSFSARSQKINLIRCLVNRAKRICSHNYLQEELDNIKKIFTNNGYPIGVIEKVLTSCLHQQDARIGPKRCPVY